MAAQLEISERRTGDIAILALSGHLVADDDDVIFTERIDALIAEGISKVIVDFHDVTIFDSGGVGVLVAKLLSVRRRGGDLRLTRLTERARRVLATTHLTTVFAAFDFEAEAIRSFDVATKV